MARKSNLQEQRELHLRGRSVLRTNNLNNQNDMSRMDGEEQVSKGPNPLPKGPIDDSNGRMKDINAIIGIPELIVETDEVAELGTTEEMAGGAKHSIALENRAINTESAQNTKEDTEEPLLQIDQDDVKDEIELWQNTVVCFILGANPPWEVVEGFIRRIWTKYNIDKISFMPHRIFLVRFNSNDMKEKVLHSGYYLFNNKPLIVIPWTKNMEMKVDKVKTVPVWVQF
ncbi:hypothetical protein vseg_010434 [Gypsophila vaccaria]